MEVFALMFGFLKKMFGSKAADCTKEAGPQVVARNDAPAAKADSVVVYIDRDEFMLPRSENVAAALELVKTQQGKPALAKALRIFEYSMAAALGADLRVDRELLALAALFSQTGANAGEAAYAFAIKNGMWDALAERIKSSIDEQATGAQSDCLETRALALGVAAEAAGGNVPYIHVSTSEETRRRHAA